MAPGFLHPNSYTITEMITLLLMVVFGGIGHIWGGVIGAIIVTIIDDLTRDYYQYRMLAPSERHKPRIQNSAFSWCGPLSAVTAQWVASPWRMTQWQRHLKR